MAALLDISSWNMSKWRQQRRGQDQREQAAFRGELVSRSWPCKRAIPAGRGEARSRDDVGWQF